MITPVESVLVAIIGTNKESPFMTIKDLGQQKLDREEEVEVFRVVAQETILTSRLY